MIVSKSINYFLRGFIRIQVCMAIYYSQYNFLLSIMYAYIIHQSNGKSNGSSLFGNDNSRTVNQTNNSPKSLSRLEIYRQTRNGLNV